MSTENSERRRRSRQNGQRFGTLQVQFDSRLGIAITLLAKVIDVNEGGFGVQLASSLKPGEVVRVQGKLDGAKEFVQAARVSWCVPTKEGFRVGLSCATPDLRSAAPEVEYQPSGEPDYYEILQVNPKADQDTIQRVYRILAQRYHPDHAETGNSSLFRWVTQAYKTLGEPESRAAYDVQRAAEAVYRVKIFSKPADAQGVEGEKRKRHGILRALYTQRMNSADHPWLTIPQLEDLLSVPREHLEFALWYLREHQLVTRSDSARFVITAAGVDRAESTMPEEMLIRRPLLEAPAA
ncbi:MAG: DnaJ domain-containing protein [Bryobacteraceae bacterium]|nr:DnaJ domain-containing protein [Bryobacteraceae bacterium]